jgi:ADP-heptose:LPS heptosyltransferase
LKTRNKIIIDSLIGTLLAHLINWMARLLGAVLRIDHSLHRDFKTIVISKYAGLGSIIQATPLLQTLRKKYPDSKLYFVTTQANATLLKLIPEVSETLLVSDKNLWSIAYSSFNLIIHLWQIKPELYIDLEFYSNYSGIITTLSKATNRLGFYKEDKSYRKGTYNYLVPFSVNSPISKTYLQFADLLICNEKITTLKIEVPTLENVYSSRLGLEKEHPYIVVNPNASDLRLERRWPKESYIATLNFLLKERPNYKIILIGNKMEAAYVDEIESAIADKKNLINSSGKLTLSELVLLIAGAELMLTNDTGPMHIAFALKIKTISLFGPCSPEQYGDTSNGVVFYKKVACSPCVHNFLIPPCHGDNICMKNIQVEEIEKALLKNLTYETWLSKS